MAISAKDVMALRQRTGMGMMECKKALNEAAGDTNAAVEILRRQAKGKMDERTDRAAAEGTLAIAAADDRTAAALIELNTETDFTARNEATIEAADKIARHALDAPDGEVASDDTTQELVDGVRLTTKENTSFGRGIKYAAGEGERIGSYLHHNRQVGVLVQVRGDVDEEVLAGLAQHVAAADGVMLPAPLAADESGLSAELRRRMQKQFADEAEATGKPPEIAEKISTGKLRKWIEDHTLLGQPYVKDMSGKSRVRDILPRGAEVLRFIRYQVGVR